MLREEHLAIFTWSFRLQSPICLLFIQVKPTSGAYPLPEDASLVRRVRASCVNIQPALSVESPSVDRILSSDRSTTTRRFHDAKQQ